MKRIFIILVAFITFFSCEEESVKLDNYVVIGDTNANIEIVDSLIKPAVRCDSATYSIDLDKDGINDFRISTYFCYSPSHYCSEFNIYCLQENSKVLCSDTLLTPAVLNIGDTLEVNSNWENESMRMLWTSCIYCIIDGDGILYKHGLWYNIENKYIGIALEQDKNFIFGWIKLSISEDYEMNSIVVHEIGSKKASNI